MSERTQEYIITIRADGNATLEDANAPKAPSAAKTTEGEKVSGQGKKELTPGQKLTKGIIQSAAFGYAKRAVLTVARAQTGTIQLRTGQVQYQERQQAVLGYLEGGLNIAESAALGYATGNVYGAVIAAAVSTVTKVINFGIESNKLDLQRTVDDIGRAQANIRAGAGGGRMGKNY